VLKRLKDLFDNLQPAGDAGADEHLLQLATAVMLVEVMRADATFHADERAAVRAALCVKFAIAHDEAQRLAELYAFTSRINERFEMAQKIRMVELMWGVAYADGHLSAHERHVMWRIADLLHVPQAAYQHARQRAQRAAEAR
jgi:uncharacterized tellurite resistance protein B-like protein